MNSFDRESTSQAALSAGPVPRTTTPRDRGNRAGRARSVKVNSKTDNSRPLTVKSSTPPKTSTPVIHDIAGWARTWKHRVRETDSLCIEFCNQNSIPYYVAKEAVNPHSISHVARDECVRLLLIREGRMKLTLDILDYFGGQRNLKFQPQQKKDASNAVVYVDGVRTPLHKALSINWTIGPNVAFAGDSGRVTHRQDIPEGKTFDFVLSQDVYHGGPCYYNPFTPSTAKEVLRFGKLYVVCHIFSGFAGFDDLGVKKIEQVFVRDASGLIVSSPDAVNANYPTHPDINWIKDNRSLEGIDISPVNCPPPYFAALLTLTQEDSFCAGPTVPRTPAIDKITLTIPQNSFLNFSDSGFWEKGTHELVVHVQSFVQLNSSMIVKAPNGQTQDTITGRVNNIFEKDPVMIAIRSRYPMDKGDGVVSYDRILKDTIKAIMYKDRVENTSLLKLFRQRHFYAEQDLVFVRSSNGSRESESFITVIIALMLLTLASVASLYNRYFLPAAFFNSFPLTSACLEELLAFSMPSAYYSGVFLEFARDVRKNPLGAMVNLMVHGSLNVLREFGFFGRLLSLMIHLGWNHHTKRPRAPNRYEVFKENYVKGLILDDVVETWLPIPTGDHLPSYTTKAYSGNSVIRGVVSIYVAGQEVTFDEAFDLLREDSATNCTYPILVSHRLLQQPANNSCNLLMAIRQRICVDPFVDNNYPEEFRHEVWSRLAQLIVDGGLLQASSKPLLSEEEVAAKMGKKGLRISKAWQAFMLGQVTKNQKSINLKWNEHLSCQKDIGGILTMKPRAIQNLEPHVHALMGPFADYLNNCMHESFCADNIHTFCGYTVRIIFASGYTGQQLTDIARSLLDGVFTVVVSGDDSIVSFGDQSRDGYSFGEADQSAFDHTQDDGPCKILQGAIQRHLDIPPEFTALAYKCCSSSWYARKKNLFVRGASGTQMPTGIKVTTTYNSMSTVCFWLWWLINPGLSVVEAGQQVGFKVKYYPRDSLSQATFLKGWWLITVDGRYVWRPLPSALIKLGKMIRDPVDITTFVRRGKKMRRSREEAIGMCALALANSYPSIKDDYPVLGPFVLKLKTLGNPSPSALTGILESAKPLPSEGVLDYEQACIEMECRYGITRGEIVSVTRLINAVTVLPAYIEHNVFDKLVEVDY